MPGSLFWLSVCALSLTFTPGDCVYIARRESVRGLLSGKLAALPRVLTRVLETRDEDAPGHQMVQSSALPSCLCPGAGTEEAPQAGVRPFSQLKPGQSPEKIQLKDDQTGVWKHKFPDDVVDLPQGRDGAWLPPGFSGPGCAGRASARGPPRPRRAGGARGPRRSKRCRSRPRGAVTARGAVSATAQVQRETPD